MAQNQGLGIPGTLRMAHWAHLCTAAAAVSYMKVYRMRQAGGCSCRAVSAVRLDSAARCVAWRPGVTRKPHDLDHPAETVGPRGCTRLRERSWVRQARVPKADETAGHRALGAQTEDERVDCEQLTGCSGVRSTGA